MIWQNLSELLQAFNRNQYKNLSSIQVKPPVLPAERWGHTSVSAHNRMFIIGGY